MKIIAQAFTGGFNSPSFFSDKYTEKLISVIDGAGAESVIIGWNTNAPYGRITSLLHELGKKALLWLPVFSEYGGAAVPAVDFTGGMHAGAVSGAEDDFTFACPCDPGNIRLAADYYDKYFSGCEFDGVFLDKIRFSTFGNGFKSGMGCFCERCRDFYSHENVDIDVFRSLMGNEKKDFLAPASRFGMRYTFEDKLIDRLYQARAKLITSSVKRASEMFRQRGLDVGLDVFAPPLAYLFGQDIEALADCAGFIKPMLYRVTDAPAGIPYETGNLKKELMKNGCNALDSLEKLWDTAELTSEDCLIKQLKLLANISCPTYCGVEVNKTAFCGTSKEYVETTINAVKKAGIAGCVLSWNVLAETVYP